MGASLATNAKWVFAIQAAKAITQVLSLSVLARMLAPEDYGIVAMSAVATNLALMFKDFGTTASVIQAKEITQEKLNSIFWVNLSIGCLLALALMGAAYPLSLWFSEPRLTGVLLLSSLVFAVGGVGIVPLALLERESSFKAVAKIEIGGLCLGLFSALCAAYLGAGPYSLVIQSIVYSFCSALFAIIVRKWVPTGGARRTEVRASMLYARPLVGFNLINYISRNADSLIIGRYVGVQALGQYSLAYRIMLLPLQYMTFVATRAMFPILSRAQDDPSRLRLVYCSALTAVAFVTAPMMGGLWALREQVVPLFFGEGWGTVVVLLGFLAPVGFLQSLTSTTGAVLMAVNKNSLMLRLAVLNAVLQVVAFVIGVNWGVVGVVFAYMISNILYFFPLFFVVMRALGGRLTEVLVATAPPFLCAAAMAALISHLPLDAAFLGHKPGIFSVIACVLLGAVMYLSLFFVAFRGHLRKVATVIR